jgi:hypothetical protein
LRKIYRGLIGVFFDAQSTWSCVLGCAAKLVGRTSLGDIANARASNF